MPPATPDSLCQKNLGILSELVETPDPVSAIVPGRSKNQALAIPASGLDFASGKSDWERPNVFSQGFRDLTAQDPISADLTRSTYSASPLD